MIHGREIPSGAETEFSRSRSGAPVRSDTQHDRHAGEDGYILLAVLFMVVLVLISLSVAAPKVAADIQRDREIELMHRGLQYRRAIQLYYRKFNAYPPSLDALEKSNNIRFLRKRYVDPATGKDEWHLIHFGENKTPAAMGFFGQPIAGSTLAGIGPGASGQAFGSSPIGTSAIGGTNTSAASSGIGTSPGSTAGQTQTSGTDPNAGAAGGTGTTSTSAFGSNNGQTFGGGGIIGVESTSPKATILEYKKKNHFNEWEFVYDPTAERQQAIGATGAGLQNGGPGNSPTGAGGTTPGLGGGPPQGVPQPNGGTGPPAGVPDPISNPGTNPPQ